MPPRIVGFDPATRFGWAVEDASGWRSGVWKLPSGAEAFGPRLVACLQKLDEFLHEIGPENIDLAALEGAGHFRSQAATRNHYALSGILVLALEARKIPWVSLSPGEVKKYATGNGAAKKPAMLVAAESRWPGYEFETDDEVDARFVVATARAVIGNEK